MPACASVEVRRARLRSSDVCRAALPRLAQVLFYFLGYDRQRQGVHTRTTACLRRGFKTCNRGCAIKKPRLQLYDLARLPPYISPGVIPRTRSKDLLLIVCAMNTRMASRNRELNAARRPPENSRYCRALGQSLSASLDRSSASSTPSPSRW